VALRKLKNDADHKLLQRAYEKISDGRDILNMNFHSEETGAIAVSSLKVIDGELAILSSWIKGGDKVK
jgi:hypothetical protein